LSGLAYETVASDLPFPTVLTAVPGAEWAILATKDGRLWRFEDGSIAPAPLLDLADAVRNEGERGLLGVAFHPDDPGRIFVHYSASDGDTVVSEFHGGSEGIDRDSERVLLRVDQPAANHNGGPLLFDPQGRLLVGLGDGGGAGDRYRNGQDSSTLLGAILRIDPDPAGDRPYGIPADNPYAAGGGAPEVWAIGVRNPWRIALDGGLLYIADVGQNAYEEVDVIPVDEPGPNLGWNVMEGLHCYGASGCAQDRFVAPVLEVEHGDGGACSISGGVVYRGSRIPELTGHYLYSDFCGGWLRSFRFDGAAAVDRRDWTSDVGALASVVGFGVDGAGEVYVLTAGGLHAIVPVREG
jgi:glucose/arabinose dehydrogenase